MWRGHSCPRNAHVGTDALVRPLQCVATAFFDSHNHAADRLSAPHNLSRDRRGLFPGEQNWQNHAQKFPAQRSSAKNRRHPQQNGR